MGRGEQEWPGGLNQVISQILAAGDIAAQTAHGLGERAHIDIPLTLQAEMVNRATTVFAQDAFAMRIINHGECAVLFGQLGNFRQRSDIPIHAEYAVGDNHDARRSLCFLKHLFEFTHVLVFEDLALRLSQADAVNDTGVIEFIADNHKFFILTLDLTGKHGLNHAPVGGDAGHKNQRSFHMLEFSQFLFQLGMDIHGADDRPDRGGAGAPFFSGFYHRFFHLGMVSQPEIIIG